MARFMKYKDEISYEGAPLAIGADGRYSEADARQLNTPISHELSQEVVRLAGGDVGMNRSLFQRLISAIHATNGAASCNKEGAELPVRGGALGIDVDLRFPDPGAKDPLVALTIPLLYLDCPDPALGSTYQRCALVEQPNGAEAYARSVIGRTLVKLKDAQLLCLAASQDPPQDVGAVQERDSQLEGFTLTPTPEAVARFLYAPRNALLSAVFAPFLTRDGVPLVEYEPNLLFALEVKDPNVMADGQPQSFITSSASLCKAFDDHEIFETGPSGPVAKHGYLFADLLSSLHMHWDSPRSQHCPRADPDPVCQRLGLSGVACSAGCTQSLNPDGSFYSKQTNLVSYEPLLIEALLDEGLADVLSAAGQAVASIEIACEDGVTRDGLTVVADFLARLLTPDPDLADYGAKRRYTKTNTCIDSIDPASGQPACGCPQGSTELAGKCTLASGAVVPRGRILAQTTPLHLVLDALARFDATFAEPESRGRLAPWRAARSALVDQFFSVDRIGDPADASKVRYALANQRTRAVGIHLVQWLRARVAAHREDAGLDDWARGLPERLARVLGHPLLVRALDLFDTLWEAPAPARELSRLGASLLDPAHAEAFAGLALAAADLLELLDRDRALSPLIEFASVALAPNAFAALDAVESGSVLADVQNGSALRALELLRKVADLDTGGAPSSVVSRLLKHAVLGDPRKQGRAPLETILDAIADVNRADPRTPSSEPLSAADHRQVLSRVQLFLSDRDRGLERLYDVIRGRALQ
jgi:hypothetical protein